SDLRARELARHLAVKYGRERLLSPNELERGKCFVAAGAGPSLRAKSALVEALVEEKDCVVVAADGAYRLLSARPNIVVTDLDGLSLAELLDASSRAVLVIHAHGDNLRELLSLVPPLLRGGARILLTSQVGSSPPVYDIEGFTDGDRAVALAGALAERELYLIGMDLGLQHLESSLAPRGRPLFSVAKMRAAMWLLREMLCELSSRVRVVNLSYTPFPCSEEERPQLYSPATAREALR
ncbi:MAG: 6-hydroxymethylpterin diphosphokinase MptE-like protein, partial [Fervidicoccaceae archaeon]